MEYQQVKILLERYFQGESSIEEERNLRRYFSGPNVDERLGEYAPMFSLFVQEKSRKLEVEKADQLMRQLPQIPAKRLGLRSGPVQLLIRIAAVLVLMLGMYWAYDYQQDEPQTAEVDWSKYEITDEKAALEITKGALFKVSKTLHEGAGTAAAKLDRMQEVGKFFK